MDSSERIAQLELELAGERRGREAEMLTLKALFRDIQLVRAYLSGSDHPMARSMVLLIEEHQHQRQQQVQQPR